MAESEKRAPDPEDYLCVPLEKATSGASPAGQVGVEGDPREPSPEEAWEVVPTEGPPAPGDSPPAKESGSRAISDVNSMSNEVIVQYLHCKFKAVSFFPDPAAREFLIARLRQTEEFVRLLELQAQESGLKAENQRLYQEVQEAKRSNWKEKLPGLLPWTKTNFHIQVLITGKTGGCEKQFLKKVSDCLSNQHIDLKREKYQEDSRHFLLVFCPVASRVGTDMQNALEDLQGEPKAVLVMLHHKPKESASFVDTKLQAHHPAVVRTVHARYTIQEGFYTCPVNEEAVAIVAEVLEQHSKRAKEVPANPGSSSKSWNV